MNDLNLSLQRSTGITVSTRYPTGVGARDPHVLLNERAHHLHGRPLPDFMATRTYDTYDGQNGTHNQDWYAIEFADHTTFNCIEMTTGLPTGLGGWWTSMAVEVRADAGDWWPVENFHILQAYNFEDTRGERRPFETYTLAFDEVKAQAVRVIGQPGGPARFTSLARLAVYQRDLSRWNPVEVSNPPIPRTFQLIPPETIWDLCEHLTKVAGMMVNFSFLEYYLDEERYEQYWGRAAQNHAGTPELWSLLGDRRGRDSWAHLLDTSFEASADAGPEPRVLIFFHDTLALVVAPVVVEDEDLGQILTEPVVLKNELDWEHHYRMAQAYNLAWPCYRAALDRSPQMTLEQLEGAAAMMSLIAATIGRLVHSTVLLEQRLDGAGRGAESRSQMRKAVVQQAIDFMETNLEAPVGVADVARTLGFSLPYFSTLFTEMTGRNPRDFLIDLRVERAKEYLLHTSMSVREVCTVLGYSRSYFSRVFKQRTGRSPEEFARHLRPTANTSRSSL